MLGVLCPPNSPTAFKDLPEDQQIGGYPRPGQLQLNGNIDELMLDSEGRCVILEFPAFVLIGMYSPANRDESRDDFRLGYMEALDVRVRNLVAMGKRVIVMGDLNVVRDVADTANLPERLRKENMTAADFFAAPSRRVFNQLLFEGNVVGSRDEGREAPVLWDLCRLFHPTREGMFTCWDTKKNTRPANVGSRIDYVLCSGDMKSWFIDSNIQEGLMGSDHCPVYAIINETVEVNGERTFIKDLMNPRGTFEKGERLREWSTKDLLPMSAKLIPEFDRRRNIKDMFFKKPVVSKTGPTPSQEAQANPSNDLNKSVPSGSPADSAGLGPPPSPIPASSPAAPSNSLKRTSSIPASSNKPQKKARPGLSKETSTKGQSNLMGFLKPKATDSGVKQSEKNIPPVESTAGAKSAITPSETITPNTNGDETGGGSAYPESEDVFDPIEAKESWSKLLGKRIVPKCEHGENCISLVTKKPGMNCGKCLDISLITTPTLSLSHQPVRYG